jgi:hypothetical protein
VFTITQYKNQAKIKSIRKTPTHKHNKLQENPNEFPLLSLIYTTNNFEEKEIAKEWWYLLAGLESIPEACLLQVELQTPSRSSAWQSPPTCNL